CACLAGRFFHCRGLRCFITCTLFIREHRTRARAFQPTPPCVSVFLPALLPVVGAFVLAPTLPVGIVVFVKLIGVIVQISLVWVRCHSFAPVVEAAQLELPGALVADSLFAAADAARVAKLPAGMLPLFLSAVAE